MQIVQVLTSSSQPFLSRSPAPICRTAHWTAPCLRQEGHVPEMAHYKAFHTRRPAFSPFVSRADCEIAREEKQGYGIGWTAAAR